MPIEVLAHRSAVLEGNPLGDPHERELWLYLPPDYARGKRRYPVLWALAPFAGSGAGELVGTRWSPGLAARLDRLIAGGMPPVIVAAPDCFTRLGGSQYVSSSALGRYEDYLCDELVPFVDATLRTRAEPGARGLFGRSSGGYGAMRLTMRRPECFAAFASHSGDVGFAMAYLPDFATAAAALGEAGSVAQWLERFEAREKKRAEDFAVVNVLAMAAAYSPAPGAPLGIELPFELESGELRPEVWRRWQAADPLAMLEQPEHQAAWRQARLCYLDCGRRDEYRLHVGARRLRERLVQLGIDHVYDEHDDDHRGLSYRYELSLPQLAAALGGPLG